MINSHDLASRYNLKLINASDSEIKGVTSLDNQKDNYLTWVKSENFLDKIKKGLVLINSSIDFEPKNDITYLITEDSTKLIFSKILQRYFVPKIDFYLKNCVDEHINNSNIKVSDNVFIGQNVTIGKGTIIFPNVVIEANSVIGSNCIIKSHVSIGTEGLGLELDKSMDKLMSFPQIGNAILNDNVDIGPNSTVRRGALGSTIIKSNSKIGSMVNIGHNCEIGKNCILTCNIVTGGSSVIGDYSFIGINTVIKNGLNIGENCIIGMGSVVTKNIESQLVAYGNPSKVIRKNK
tara:strand:+ start:4012 stop:4887 length:876 start_codon:yes stop_codon:yes gene_type:complete